MAEFMVREMTEEQRVMSRKLRAERERARRWGANRARRGETVAMRGDARGNRRVSARLGKAWPEAIAQGPARNGMARRSPPRRG